jgi:hypothetical protein
MPWPTNAAGTGSSVQLIDPNQENARVGNWFANYVPAVYCCGSYTPPRTNDGWQFVSSSGSIGSGSGGGQMRLIMFLGTELGTALVDDLWLVEGTNAAVGYNYIRNGDFEQPLYEQTLLTNSWMVGTNYTNSLIVSSPVHSGNGALQLTPTTFGNSVVISAITTNNRVIYQALSPAPAVNSTNTLSFWYWATNSSTNLTIRIVNSAVGSVNVTTNINVSFTPSSTVLPKLVAPATNSLSPGAGNQNVTSLPAFPPLWIIAGGEPHRNHGQPRRTRAVDRNLQHEHQHRFAQRPVPLVQLHESDELGLPRWSLHRADAIPRCLLRRSTGPDQRHGVSHQLQVARDFWLRRTFATLHQRTASTRLRELRRAAQ